MFRRVREKEIVEQHSLLPLRLGLRRGRGQTRHVLPDLLRRVVHARVPVLLVDDVNLRHELVGQLEQRRADALLNLSRRGGADDHAAVTVARPRDAPRDRQLRGRDSPPLRELHALARRRHRLRAAVPGLKVRTHALPALLQRSLRRVFGAVLRV